MGQKGSFFDFNLQCAIFIFYTFTNLILICDCVRQNSDRLPPSSIELSMPNVTPKKNDDYYCTTKNIEEFGTQYIHSFEPNSNADRAHHMILFACNDVPEELTKNGWWDCGHHYQACSSMRIIYAWAKNAPPTELPPDVGLRIGPESNIKNIVLQVHYAHPLPEGTTDHSGFKLHVSQEEPKFLAGVMILYRSYLNIPKNTEKIHGDMNCMLNSDRPIHPFAYRVHTHKLGVVVTGYAVNQTTGFRQIGKGNPQWPQAFYPIGKDMTINPKEIIAARCTYSTIGFDKDTRIGQTAGDEMCNLYIMFYTDSRDPEAHALDCGDEMFPAISNYLPSDSDVPLPRNTTLEEHAKAHVNHDVEVAVPINSISNALDVKKKNHAKKRPGTDFMPGDVGSTFEDENILDGRLDSDRQIKASAYQVKMDWPKDSVHVGQASGVDFDTLGNIVVFHRGDRTWNYATFDNQDRYQQQSLGPISTDTVFVISPTTGNILHQWGKNLFYMPHDITVAPNGDTYLTDVALHQVFRFTPGSVKPDLVLGRKFEPGSDDNHFCKPAAVAAMTNGDFFVADGYCNNRIIKFNSKGNLILKAGRAYKPSIVDAWRNTRPPPYAFNIPHALALAEDQDLVCVADRENGRIQCLAASDLSHQFTVENRLFGHRLFSVAYSPYNGGTLYAVNGPDKKVKVQGFVIPLSTKAISSVFSPANRGFSQPHDIAVSKNGSELYVVEIATPYHVWKFENCDVAGRKQSTDTNAHDNSPGPKEPERRVNPTKSPGVNPPASHQVTDNAAYLDEDSFSTSVIIMAFLTIPLLLLIGVGALLRLRSSGCCRRTKEPRSFAEFFPPSAGFEKLRMDESESDNSDTERFCNCNRSFCMYNSISTFSLKFHLDIILIAE
ncbi:unnamed protein product [Allacma fusca]|uniref:peptidylglycine monooxygenase n=1 Tax=Allacma fusca TaxID=39272 RepID=A0A8J2NGH4_9HEXA|nr:unnamed protein product [Allacma fusca]